MKPLQLALLLTLLSVPATAEVTTTIRHSVLFQGKIKGRQITQQAANGLWTVDYSYRDNGRGPDYKEEIRLDAAGTQVEHRVRGKSTFGAPATEDFERKSGVAHWKTISDSGTKSVSTTAFYVPVNTAMEAYAMLARAALQRPGGKIAALPSGDVTVARIATHEAQAAGRKQKLALYALTGLDLEPTYLWLTDDSARKLFAYVYPGWMQLVLEGWESAAPGIEAAQLAAERKWLEDLATRLTHRLPEPILIRNTRVFDSVKGSLGPSSDVFVFDGRIAGIWKYGR